MKTVLIRDIDETDEINIPEADFTLDLRAREVKNCTGCWSCWQKTPGRCALKDLDDFYAAYINADRLVLFIQVSCDFISGRLKTLFDRMIPHYLPYTNYQAGESIHYPRYERYPDVEVFFKGTFRNQEARQLFEDYLRRVTYQFHIKKTTVQSIDEYAEEGATV